VPDAAGLRRVPPHHGRGVRDVDRPLPGGRVLPLIVFAIPLGLSLALVALELVWARLLFVVLSLLLVAANIGSAVRIRGVAKVMGSTALLVNEVATSVLALALVVLPWVLGGLRPTRKDLTLAIILAFGARIGISRSPDSPPIWSVPLVAESVSSTHPKERRREGSTTHGPRIHQRSRPLTRRVNSPSAGP
jgi:hypothetical protein